jgi:hypothetical protein
LGGQRTCQAAFVFILLFKIYPKGDDKLAELAKQNKKFHKALSARAFSQFEKI